jgi:hypothetical protein
MPKSGLCTVLEEEEEEEEEEEDAFLPCTV